MPVSPVLSNLILKPFDDALINKGIIAIRYADDIAVFGKNRNDCIEALNYIRDKLAELNLEVPDLDDNGKTSIRGPSEIVQFLGVEIRRFEKGYKLRAPAKKFEMIESKMAEVTSIDACIKNYQNIGQVVRMLDSFIIGHAGSMTVLDDEGEFLKKLQAAKRRHLTAMLISLVGENAVKKLDPFRLAILGLHEFPRN